MKEMKKRKQLNIEIEEDLLKTLKFMALAKNIKLNALVKDILSEKVISNTTDENNKKISDELDEIKKRISQLENSLKN